MTMLEFTLFELEPSNLGPIRRRMTLDPNKIEAIMMADVPCVVIIHTIKQKYAVWANYEEACEAWAGLTVRKIAAPKVPQILEEAIAN